MSLLGFCSAVWGWTHPPPPSVIFIITKTTTCNPCNPSLPPPSSFNSPTSLIPPPFFFYLSIAFPFTPPLFSHSLFFYPRLFHFTPSPTLLEYTITNHYKAFDSGQRCTSSTTPPPFAQSSPQPGYVRSSTGSGGPCDAPALPVASIVR